MNQNKSFLDKGTLIALVIVMGFWLLWSRYMETKYPQPQQNAGTPSEVVNSNDPQAKPAAESTAAAGNTISAGNAGAPQAAAQTSETVIEFSDDKMSFVVSSKGMGLKKINVKPFTTRDGKPIVLSKLDHAGSFSTVSVQTNEPINFSIERLSATEFVGRGSDGAQQIEKRIRVDSENFRLFVETALSGTVTGTAVQIADELVPYKGTSIFTPSYDHQDFFVAHEDTEKRTIISSDEGLNLTADNVSVLGLNDHYFATGLIDRSDIAPRFETNIPRGAKEVTGRLVYKPTSNTDALTIKYEGFAGPKELPILRKIDEKLTLLIDYGMFKMLAKPLLDLLRLLHGLVNNWGVAIILLTLIVRILVMPFNVYSFKSMKAMQKIQPEMKSIREKYKSDPTKMNQEVMALMKRSKANPLGGCLPMLLQLPVFLALFSSLSMSIELYRAPFIFWIQDLSVKDPFYVLPVLMGVLMYIQQKITPTTMDPAQAKVMQFMPIIFAAMMLGLPSGLTLYIFVSTAFGIVQQYLFMRDKAPATAATA